MELARDNKQRTIWDQFAFLPHPLDEAIWDVVGYIGSPGFSEHALTLIRASAERFVIQAWPHSSSIDDEIVNLVEEEVTYEEVEQEIKSAKEFLESSLCWLTVGKQVYFKYNDLMKRGKVIGVVHEGRDYYKVQPFERKSEKLRENEFYYLPTTLEERSTEFSEEDEDSEEKEDDDDEAGDEDEDSEEIKVVEEYYWVEKEAKEISEV